MSAKSRLVSNRVVTLAPTQVPSDRYQWLSLDSAEPNLGYSSAGSILTTNLDGDRIWSNAITVASLTSTGNITATGNVTATSLQGNAVSVTGLTLSKSLGDVTINSPSADQVLAWNGTRWVNATSNVPTVSTVFASSAYDMGYVYDADITVFEDEGYVYDATTSIYDLGILSFTGIISLNNLDSSVRNDYVGFSIIFGF
jgi:hypothetical protein